MANADSGPKRSGLGWIPKLSLWAVVIAFAFLYLSSIERSPRQDAANTGLGETSRADASGVDQVIGKITDLTSTAGAAITDATSAGASGVKEWIGKIKEVVRSPEVSSAGMKAPESGQGEPVPPQAAMGGAAATAPGLAEPGAPAPAVGSERLAQGERPAASGFEQHYAPLPAHASMPAPSQGAAPKAEDTGPATGSSKGIADAVPVSDAESAVFAESLMHEESPPEPAVSADTASQSLSATDAPAPAAKAPPLVPVVPQPAGTIEPAPGWGMPLFVVPAIDEQQLANRRAEYERMRREADQRAREYWEKMPAPAPVGAPAYPGYGPIPGPAVFGPPTYPW